MGSVTENRPDRGSLPLCLQSESTLHPAAREYLFEAFDGAWASPAKIHQSSRKSQLLLGQAREIFQTHLGLRSEELSLLGETPIAFHLGISGLLRSDSTLIYPKTARSVVYAIESHPTVVLDVDQQGNFQRPAAAPQDLLVWQAANPETGLIGQSLEKFEGQLFVDSVTSSASSISWNLPHWSSAIWDSRAWRGPSGISIFGLKDRNKWRNPLPHNDARVTSGHFSIPLALASALALEASVKSSTEDQATLRHLNQLARTFISQEIPGSQIACNIDQTDPALLSFTIPEMDSQLLVQELDRIGIEVDTGSACSSMNMQPSHVLAAMGFNTTGHVRVTLRPTITPDQLLWALQEIKRISAPSED